MPLPLVNPARIYRCCRLLLFSSSRENCTDYPRQQQWQPNNEQASTEKKTEKKQQRNKSNEWNAKKKWWKSFNLCTLFETLYNKSCMQLTFVFDRYTVSCSCVFCCCCCCSQCFFPIFVFHFYHRSLMGEAVFFIQWVHGFFIWLTLCFCVL